MINPVPASGGFGWLAIVRKSSIKKYMMLPGPENAVHGGVAYPWQATGERPLASRVTSRSAIVPFVNSWGAVLYVGA